MNTKSCCTVIVQTCDAFSDCWEPFFELLSRYWPDCPYELVLSTESMRYTHASLNIRCYTAKTHGIASNHWSDRLIGCLQFVQTPYVLHIQDDYFIKARVQGQIIDEALAVMEAEAWTHIGLTHFGPRGRLLPTRYGWLHETPRLRRYRVNTQAGLWDRLGYLSVLKPRESCWQFEILGTWRERWANRKFGNVAANYARHNPIVGYTGTGILKGRWHPEIPRLFAAEGFAVDFTKRGMARPTTRFASKVDIAGRLCQSPGKALAAFFLGK